MILQAEPQPKSHGLSLGNFRCIANHGFGDAANGYAWSGAWHRGHLYVGTNRHTLAILKKRVLVDTPARMWPVPIPESDDVLDLRAHIWRYEPVSGRWDRVFQSPMTDGLENRRVPVAYGFRNMVVFQGESDDEPAIYTIPACGSYGKGPVLMRSGDGEQFDVISEPGLGLGDPNITTFRGVVPFKGRLFISPSGSRGKCNMAFNATVMCSADPRGGAWEFSSLPGFGDPVNLGVFELGVFNGHLYAGTINVRGGFKKVMDELMGDAFREAVSEKFDIDLSRLPAMFTARGHLREKDGQIHNDSKTKVITVLLYFNAKPWPHEGGKLRMLRGPDDMEDFAEEVAPEGGLLIVFKRSDHSWHGHPSFVGPRKAIQLNWVTDQGVVFRETGKHNLTATIKKLKRAVGVS